MTREWIWCISSCMVMIALIWRFVPTNGIRQAWASFLIMQAQTWVLGAIIVNYHWLEFPVRLFPAATKQNLLSNFLLYPCVSVLFYCHYPKNSRVMKVAYTSAYALAIAVWDYAMAEYTDLQNNVHWKPYYHFILAFLTLLVSKWLVNWMFRERFPRRSAD